MASSMVAYTHSGAKNLVDGSGDRAALHGTVTQMLMVQTAQRFSYAKMIPDKVIGSASYRLEDTKWHGQSHCL